MFSPIPGTVYEFDCYDVFADDVSLNDAEFALVNASGGGLDTLIALNNSDYSIVLRNVLQIMGLTSLDKPDGRSTVLPYTTPHGTDHLGEVDLVFQAFIIPYALGVGGPRHFFVPKDFYSFAPSVDTLFEKDFTFGFRNAGSFELNDLAGAFIALINPFMGNFATERPVIFTVANSVYNTSFEGNEFVARLFKGKPYRQKWDEITAHIITNKTWYFNRYLRQAYLDTPGLHRKRINVSDTLDRKFLRDVWLTHLAPRRCSRFVSLTFPEFLTNSQQQ